MIVLLDQQVVIIGDLVDSRKLENRREVQEKLNFVLDEVNSKYREVIRVPFKVTLGDEFVGVLESYEQMLDLLQYMDVKFNGIELRYGLGAGLFDNYKGQGYKNALEAINTAKKNKFKVHLLMDNNRDTALLIINLLLHLYFSILAKYNGRQKYIIYQLARGKTQEEIAAVLDTSQSSISQSLKKINWALLLKTNEIFYNLQQYIKICSDICKGTYIALIAAWPTKANDERVVRNLLNSINQEYSDIIRSKLILTSLSSEDDDFYEFQGLFYNEQDKFNRILSLIVDIYIELQGLYSGLGIGDIATKIRNEALGMDGTAFYRAREVLASCFSQKMQLGIKFSNNFIDDLYAHVLSLFIEIIKSWSPKQSLAVRYKQKGLTQNQIKEKMNLSRSTVVEHLQRAGWYEYEFIFNSICNLFILDKNTTI
ncbi:hypothetical protein GM661_17890 [Iocasia frigidifontis]|uniref:SatD n=1 Tax=Iocasia fonsfrigidae TaxID=2682810 RepID=A0A8A7KEK8_9FIRM|nr:SatD family protein [Iocasia fonsfrigidae]QTL99690.1 hypothetical protein GM661_17890 [Iocasia fonsfrigidae]